MSRRKARLPRASIAGNVAGGAALNDANAGTTTLEAFTAGSLSLVTRGALTTAGAVSAGTVTLSANGVLTIGSAVAAATIDLSAPTLAEDAAAGALLGVQIPGGPFAGTLTSSGGIIGNATLLGQNQLTAVAGLPVGGTLQLLNTRSLAIEAGVGGGVTSSFHVSGGGSIEIDAPIVFNAAGGTLDLRADGIVANSDVSTGTLDLIAVASDTAPTMVLGGTVPTANALTLTDSTLAALRANTLEVGAIGAGPAIASNLVVVNLAQSNAAHSAVLQVEASGSLTETLEPGGVFAVDTLTGALPGGGLMLTGNGNTIGTIGALAVGGDALLAIPVPRH